MSIVVDVTSPPLGDGLSGKDILDAAQSHIQDKSATMRKLLTSWLNTLFQKTHTERDWLCLIDAIPLPVEDNIIVKPADFGRMISIDGGDWFLTPSRRMTGRESFEGVESYATVPLGFEETKTLIHLIPGADGSAVIKYVKLLTRAADTATPTVWQWKFLPLFERSLLSAYYEYDGDPRGLPSLALDAAELDRLKYDENRQQPITTQHRKGFLRSR